MMSLKIPTILGYCERQRCHKPMVYLLHMSTTTVSNVQNVCSSLIVMAIIFDTKQKDFTSYRTLDTLSTLKSSPPVTTWLLSKSRPCTSCTSLSGSLWLKPRHPYICLACRIPWTRTTPNAALVTGPGCCTTFPQDSGGTD